MTLTSGVGGGAAFVVAYRRRLPSAPWRRSRAELLSPFSKFVAAFSMSSPRASEQPVFMTFII
jgi:hypothetical protein